MDRTIDALRSYLERRPEILTAYLFGARGRGAAEESSDYDIGILIDDDALAGEGPYGYRAELTAELVSAAGTDRIDLVVLNGAPPLLAHRAVRDGIVIVCTDTAARIEFEVRTLKRYIDTAPLRRIRSDYLRKAVSR